MTKGEKQVADFLSELNIWWNYHHPVMVRDEEDLLRTWYPDFFLSEFGVYVEVCGLDRKENYDRRKKIYNKSKVSVIFVETFKFHEYWKLYLLRRLIEIQKNRMRILREIPLFKKLRLKEYNTSDVDYEKK